MGRAHSMALILFLSGAEKPPSGPIRTAHGLPSPMTPDKAEEGPARDSSQNRIRRVSSQSDKTRPSFWTSVTSGTQRHSHCSAASIAMACSLSCRTRLASCVYSV